MFSRDHILMQHVGRMLGVEEVDFTWKPAGVAGLTRSGSNGAALLEALKEFVNSGERIISKAELKARTGMAEKDDRLAPGHAEPFRESILRRTWDRLPGV